MEDDPEEVQGRRTASRLERILLIVLVFVPLGALGVVVAGVNLYLLASELVKLLSW